MKQAVVQHTNAEPAGFMIVHHRTEQVPLYFGPFETVEKAQEWTVKHPLVRGPIIPLYLDVDWSRR
jgi:hypothetical protein